MCVFYKRNTPSASIDIGIWMDLLETTSFLSIVVNTFIVLFTSEKLSAFGDYEWHVLVIAVFVIEHLIFFFKYALVEAIPDVPDWVT